MSENQQLASKQEVTNILSALHEDEPDSTIVQLGKQFEFPESSVIVNVSRTTIDKSPIPNSKIYGITYAFVNSYY